MTALGRPRSVPGSGRIPDRTPRRVRYTVELTGRTGPPGEHRRYHRHAWRGVSFDTVSRLVDYYVEQANVQHVTVTKWPARRTSEVLARRFEPEPAR